MANSKRDLKAFLRYDGSGRVIQGSLILRRNKPKVGNWTQVQAHECCDPFAEELAAAAVAALVACDTLGTAADFAILGDQTVTNTGTTVITGDLGLHPGTSVTGFPPGTVVGEQHITDATALQAQTDATNAYNCLRALTTTAVTDGDIGGDTLTPGVYEASSSLGITGTLTLDGGGDPNAVFIFKTGSTLITASSANVLLTNGAQPCNVYWLVGSSATLGTDTDMVGNIIAIASVTFNTGADLVGRAIALGGAVTLDTNIVSACACTINPCS